jgi:hypothetical protein
MEMEIEVDDTTTRTTLAKDTSRHACTTKKSSGDVMMCSSLIKWKSDMAIKRRRPRRQQISFGTVHVVQFWPQLGDHPFVSSGCPIALGEPIMDDGGININEKNGASYTTVVDLESYEQRRPSHQRRSSHQLRIPPEERRDMLLTMGHSPREIARQIRKIHRLRETMRPLILRQRQLDVYYSALVRSAGGTCNYKIQTI